MNTENQFNPQAHHFHQERPDIPNHLVLAVLTTVFCCLPFGIVSIVYAVQVENAILANNLPRAQMLSDKAKYWGVLAMWVGVIWAIIWFIIFALPMLFSVLLAVLDN